MVDDKTIIKVTNRSRGSVGYIIPDMGNLQRRFEHGETKSIPAEEIRKLDWTSGGHVLLKDYLQIDNKELIEELLHEVEPEYDYSEEKIKNILLNGDIDTFMDTLDFAPEGVIDLMKDLAVKLEIPDVRKRDALSKRTNCDISNMIKINQLSKTPADETETQVKQRRVNPTTSTGSEEKVRRTAPAAGKYKVVRQ